MNKHESHQYFKYKLRQNDYKICYKLYDTVSEFFWYPSVYDSTVFAALQANGNEHHRGFVLRKQGDILYETDNLLDAEEYAKSLMKLQGVYDDKR